MHCLTLSDRHWSFGIGVNSVTVKFSLVQFQIKGPKVWCMNQGYRGMIRVVKRSG